MMTLTASDTMYSPAVTRVWSHRVPARLPVADATSVGVGTRNSGVLANSTQTCQMTSRMTAAPTGQAMRTATDPTACQVRLDRPLSGSAASGPVGSPGPFPESTEDELYVDTRSLSS